MPTVIQAKPIGSRVAGEKSDRIDALDWTKGALIIFMIVYHGINYSKYRPLAFEYLAFLPPSFILITGFIVGQIYVAKYDLSTWKPYLRLALRGVKLLLLFTLLNLANSIVREKSWYDGFWEFADRSDAVFLSGNGRVAIFEVLLPIAYFLLLAPALLWLRARVSAVILFSAIAAFTLCFVLELRGATLDNLVLLSAGLVGMALGLVPLRFINRLADQWVPALLLYVFYRLCSHLDGDRYWVQIFGAIATVFVLYSVAHHLDCASAWGRVIVQLGNYSLFAYLLQIATLQVIVRLIGGKPQTWPPVLFVIASTLAVLTGSVLAMDFLRKRSQLLNTSYKTVFA